MTRPTPSPAALRRLVAWYDAAEFLDDSRGLGAFSCMAAEDAMALEDIVDEARAALGEREDRDS